MGKSASNRHPLLGGASRLPRRKVSGVRRSASAAVPEITLWGTPLDDAYRMIFGELATLAAPYGFTLRHRHHGIAADMDGLVAAEFIEVATVFSQRVAALRWFIQQGRRGFLPPAIFAEELHVDPEAFQRAFFDGIGTTAVEDDLRLGFSIAGSSRPIATLDAGVIVDDLSVHSVLEAWRRVG